MLAAQHADPAAPRPNPPESPRTGGTLVSVAALALVLFSAFLHAAWNLWAKQIGGDTRAATLMGVLEAISVIAFAPAALLVAHAAHLTLDGRALAWIAGSGFLHVAYFLLLLRGYRVSELSVVYPVARGTGPLLAAIGAALWLGERPTLLSVGGALLIALGIVILTLHPGEPRSGRVRAGVILGALVGVTIGAYTLWDGAAVSKLALPPILYYWGGELCRALVFAPFVVADRAGARLLWREHRLRVLGIALASPIAYILVLVAMSRARVSHVAPVRELSILFGAWFGARVLGEGDRARRRWAALAFVAGVLALASA